MFTGKIAVSQRFLNAILHLLGRLFQLHRAQLLHHSFGFLPGRSFAFLGVDCLEHLCHQLYLGTRCDREHIAVKVYGTPLVLGFGEYFSNSLQHTKTLVANNEFHSVQASAAEPLEEADPTGLVLFHALGGTKNLTGSVLIYRNRHQNGHIFKLSAPISAQVDPIHIDIRIAPTLQRAVPPVLNVDIRFLVQFADGRW